MEQGIELGLAQYTVVLYAKVLYARKENRVSEGQEKSKVGAYVSHRFIGRKPKVPRMRHSRT